MYNNEKFYIVTEANISANDTVVTQVYTYTGENAKADAQNKLYRLWAYGAKPDAGETRQYFSATMTEYDHNRAILLESKVFDYRVNEPAPEPEPEPEDDLDTVLRQAVADGKITEEQYTEITGLLYETE